MQMRVQNIYDFKKCQLNQALLNQEFTLMMLPYTYVLIKASGLCTRTEKHVPSDLVTVLISHFEYLLGR